MLAAQNFGHILAKSENLIYPIQNQSRYHTAETITFFTVVNSLYGALFQKAIPYTVHSVVYTVYPPVLSILQNFKFLILRRVFCFSVKRLNTCRMGQIINTVTPPPNIDICSNFIFLFGNSVTDILEH
jgi:hypothetical protein